MFRRETLIVLVCGAFIVMISAGIRQSLGLFLRPVSGDLGTGREIYSLAMAIQNIVVGIPLAGLLADRFGARIAAFGGGLLVTASFFAVASVTQPAGLYLTLGVLAGVGLSATSYVVVLGAVAQSVPEEKRSTAFGVITAYGSFGMFIVVPGVQYLLNNLGWEQSFVVISLLGILIAGLAFGLPGRPGSQTGDSDQADEKQETLPQVLRRARSNSAYLLVTAGFFVCGFHVAFIATHLPAFLSDNGVSSMTGATALALVGAFNIVGSYTFGALGDRYRKKYLLSFLYFGRAVVIGLFLFFPVTNLTALIFGATMGFLWLATVPLTSGMVAQIFGSRYLSTLYGIVFFSHQIGAFLGVWLGGRIYDATGNYTPVWLTAIALGVLAAAIHIPISDAPTTLRTRRIEPEAAT